MKLAPAGNSPVLMLSTDAAAAFLAHLRHDRGYTDATIAGYTADLVAAFDVFAQAGLHPELGAITREAIRDFLRLPTKDGREPSARTRNRRLAVLRAFFRWARDERLREDDPTEGLPWSRVHPRDPPSLSPVEVREIVDAARIQRNRWQAARDEAILVLFAQTGLRLREIAGLDVDQVNLAEAGLRRVRRKGGAEKDVVVNAEVVRVLTQWLEVRSARAPEAEPALFVSRERRRISRRMIQVLVARYARAAGIEVPVTPHVFRHAFCYLVQSPRHGQAPMAVAQRLMNHSRITTTAIYSRASEDDMREAVRKLEAITRPDGAGIPP